MYLSWEDVPCYKAAVYPETRCALVSQEMTNISDPCFQLEFPVKPRGQLQKENDAKFLQMLKEQKREGKVTDHGLYEMLQEYMIENETLR